MLLGLDTSTLTLSLALAERTAEGGLRVLEQVSEGPPKKQSELLPGLIGELLSRHRLKVAELEGMVVGLGPGSFTGLRIGVATLKALAYAAKVKLVGVSSLRAVCLEGPEDVLLFPSAVVKKGELYVGQYRRKGRAVEAVAPEDAMTPAAFAAMLQGAPDAIAFGPSIAEYRAELERHGAPAERLRDEPRSPSAAALIELASFPATQDSTELFALEPHYIRSSGAELNPKFPPLPGAPPSARIRED